MPRNRRPPWIAAAVVTCLLAAMAVGCSSPQRLTPEQVAVRDLTLDLRARMGEEAWRELSNQAWYAGPLTGEDGVRLLLTLQALGPEATDDDFRRLLQAYPLGISEPVASALDRLAVMRPFDDFLLQAWLEDGLDGGESFVVSLMDRRTQFTSRMLDELQRQGSWLRDGLNQDEQTLLRLARVAGSRGMVDFLIESLQEARFSAWRLQLGPGRETSTLLLWTDAIPEEARRRAVDLLLDIAPRVEAFAGPFGGDTLVVILDDSAGLCSADALPGRGNPAIATYDGSIQPGIVRLAPGCVQPQSLAHELTHVFASGLYPTWYAEGIADVAGFHITGRIGYAGGSGRIQLERRETDGREPFVSSPYYQEAARGTALMLDLYRLLGAEAISNLLKATGQETRISGAHALELIQEQTPPEKLAAVQALFGRWIEGY